MKTTAIGSAVSVLLVFSAISYAKSYVRNQDPKPAQISNQAATQTPNSEIQVAGQIIAEAMTSPSGPASTSPALSEGDFEVAPQTYTATAYSLPGRTASGKTVSRGLIAADPRVLPMGTRVRLEAGSWSGEYVVADTGGGVKGRRIDIWTPTVGEARQFGKRAVKLTVLEFPGKRAKAPLVRPRVVNPASTTASTQATSKQ